jgi:hypothetical protein
MARFNKRTELIIGNDTFRPQLNRVYFKDGFLYVTNSHCILRQKLTLFGFTEEEVKLLNGNSISREHWIGISKFTEHEPSKYGLTCSKNGFKVFYKYDNEGFEDQDMVVKMENVIKSLLELEKNNDTAFGLNVDLLYDLKRSMFIENHLAFNLKGARNGLLVFSNESIEYQLAVIMPVTIE